MPIKLDLIPASIRNAGALGEQLLKAVKAAARAGCQEFLAHTETPSATFADTEDGSKQVENIA